MRLLDRSGLKPDAFVRADDAADGPAILVPAERLGDALAARRPGQRIGVDWPNHRAAADLRAVQDAVDLVAVAFPRFGDGRGFSLGRSLRNQGFRGTLRASGALIPDQFAFALQCGFDEIEIDDEQAERQPVGQWLEAIGAIGTIYLNRDRPSFQRSLSHEL